MALIVITVIVLHTNPVQARVLAWSIGTLERRFDLELTADDLHYNLPARRVTLTNVKLAAKGHHDDPFFAAQIVSVKLPWAAYGGRLRFDEVAVERGRVSITRDVNGVSNLPPGRGPRDPDAPPRRIDVRGLRIHSLDFTYHDLRRDLEIAVPGIETDLVWVASEKAQGPLSTSADGFIRIRARRVEMKPAAGTMAFDGSDVELEQLALDTTDATLLVSGEISRALDQPTLNLELEGATELGTSTRWAPPPIHVSGQASFDARLTGAPSAFVLDASVKASNARVGDERDVGIDATARLTTDRIVVSGSTIQPPTGGEVQATVDVPFSAELPWQINAHYRGVDAASAFRLAQTRPLPFGAALTGTASVTRKPSEPFRLEVHNTSTPRSFPGVAPLAGDVTFIVEGNRWRAQQNHRMGSTTVRGELGGVWNRQAVTQSTFDSNPLDVITEDVGEAARYAALFGLTTPEIVRNASGPLATDVRISGIFAEPRFTGSARTAGVEIPSVGRIAFTSALDASRRALNATNVDASIGTTSVRGDVRADLASRELDGVLTVASPNAADLLTAVPENLRLQGPLSASVRLAGTVDDPTIDVELAGKGLSVADQPIDAVSATAHVVDAGVTVDRFTVRQPGGGELVGDGRYEWGPRTFRVSVDGQNLEWRGQLARLGDAEARIALKFAASGPIDQPQGEGAIDFAVTGGVAGQLIDRGLVNVRLNGDTALITGHIPTLGALITARVLPRQPFDYDAVIVMNRIDLAPIMRLAGLREEFVTGSASLSANAAGSLSDVARSKVNINLQELNADASGVAIQLVSPSRFAWNDTTLGIDSLEVSIGQGRLLASGRLGESGISGAQWQASFAGELGDLVKIGRPFGVPEALAGYGPISLTWRSTQGLDQSTANVHLERGSLGWGELPALRNLVLDAAFDGATLNVKQFTGQWQDGSVEGTASIPRGVLEARETGGAALSGPEAGFAKIRVSGLTATALAPWLSTTTLASVEGRLSATLDARITRASLEGVAGTLVVDEADFTLAGVGVRQARPSIFEIAGGGITARDVEFAAGGSPLTLTGRAQLVPTDAQTLALRLSGTADLQLLSAFAPTVATSGTGAIDVGIGGTVASPSFDGTIEVTGAEAAIRDPRIVISELNGAIALKGQRVLFQGFSGTLNGGRLTLDGGFDLEGFRPASGNLVVVAERAALEYPQGLQSEANAIVTLSPGPAGWSLVGEISVERSAYTQPISVAALIASRGTRPPVTGGGERWIDRLRLNLWVSTVQDLVVDNNYGRFAVGGGLRVLGTVADPVLAGRLTFDEGGEVFVAGNRFHVTRGSVSFTNPFRIVPEFDIELRTLVGGTDLTLTIDGPLDRLRTDVRSSDPSVDSRQAMAMLFGGLQGEDAVTLLSAELLGATGRAIGLDTLRVERGIEVDEFRADPGLVANETDPSTRLTLSKRLRPDVELILSQSLRESGGLTAIVSYKPRSNIELRGATRDNLDRSIALRHEITFGGAATGGTNTVASGPVVTEHTISGNPGRPASELVGQLDLETGDRFDFHRWQRDIDRLRQVYHDLGHYEVRVRGTRRMSPDEKTVALDYEIEPGPRTELVIEGHPLDATLQTDIADAWRRMIFDRFLLEDIRTRIARHLLEENIVGSKVEAVVDTSTPEHKQVRITVAAGTQVSAREVRPTGNTQFDGERLDNEITSAGLDIDGWLDPPRLAEAVASFYRSQGFLLANVKAEAPTVTGDTAVLPLVIEEGARFLIGDVSFPGVSPNRLRSVTNAARVQPKAPFVIDEIDAARERIEEAYAAEGFNVVQIEVHTETDDAAATVNLSFAVLEGLQQVLRNVETQGATRTDPDVIRRALRLRVGAPVNLADWSLARKRLYDTNVFRQVDIEPVPMEPTTEESAAGIQPVTAMVRVTEYPVWRLRYGGQFTDETAPVSDPDGDTRLQSLGVLADLQNQNLFGRAITAGIAGRYERDRQAGSLFTSNSSFFGLPVRSSGFVFTSRQRFHDGEVTTLDSRFGVTAEQRWRPIRSGEVIWSYRFERSHQTIPDLPPDWVELLPVHSAKLNAGFYFDRRDDPSDPTAGWFTSANWDQAVQALGSDYASGKVLLQQAAYRAVKRLTFAGRVQLGSGYGEDALLRSERFLLGGATTVRGYAEESLGPRDILGFPAGGDALLNLNGEMRFPVRGWVQGVAFVDAGNVFAERSDLSFRDLAFGYGLGLRLASPYAMLRVDFGIPGKTLVPDRPANQWRSGRWYFGVGHIF
jgi:outer membrane protein assembly complex protein YaeT